MGLSKLVYTQLISQILEHDERVYCFVKDDNEISIKLHEKLGFKNAGELAWSLFTSK